MTASPTTAPTSPTAAPACHHMWIKPTLMRPRLTRCERCHDVVLVFHDKRKCSLCNIYYHEQCFQAAMAPSSATASVSDLTLTHEHLFYERSFVLPTKCALCNKFIVIRALGGDGLECVDCDLTVHRKCLTSEPFRIVTADDVEQSSQERARSLETHKQAVLQDVTGLMKAFNARHHRWPLGLLNPVALRRLQVQHSKLYSSLVDAMPWASADHLAQLPEVRNALRYATAVYGQSYSEGYFQGVFHCTMMRIVRTDLLAAKSENNNTGVTDVLGLPRSDLVDSEWGADVWDPSYAVILDKAHSLVVLAFRGSLSDADFLTDACGKLMHFLDREPALHSRAHQGILAMVERLFDAANPRSLVAKGHLQRALLAYPDYTWLVTGHSLGAGLTQLFSAKVLHDSSNALSAFAGRLRSVAFAPPPTMTSPVVDALDEKCIAVIAGKDVVPRLQLTSVDRFGAELAVGTSKPDGSSAQPHPDLDGEECSIAGKIWLLSSSTNRHTRLLAPVPRQSALLHTIFASPHMIPNHTMDNYAEALMTAEQNVPSHTTEASPPHAPLQ